MAKSESFGCWCGDRFPIAGGGFRFEDGFDLRFGWEVDENRSFESCL